MSHDPMRPDVQHVHLVNAGGVVQFDGPLYRDGGTALGPWPALVRFDGVIYAPDDDSAPSARLGAAPAGMVYSRTYVAIVPVEIPAPARP